MFEEKLLPPKRAAEFLGVSISQFWNLIKESDFPKKRMISERNGGWWLTELREWVEKRSEKLAS